MTFRGPPAAQALESDLAVQVAENYSQRGYEVTLEPNLGDLPPSLRKLRPDLLATRGDDHVAVLIKASSRPARAHSVPDVDALRAQGWRAELFFADDPRPPIAPPDVVTNRVREVAQLVDSQHGVAALLLVWAAVEEALRTLAARFAPSEASRELFSPDQAYSLGLLSENQLHLFNNLRDLRNQAAHNVTAASASESFIRDAVELLRRMISPTYLPPPIMADHVFAQLDPNQDALEQVKRLFPEADPTEQSEAADYITPLERSLSQQVTVTAIDDLDGVPADETISFSFGGSEYEIDLSTENADAFRAELAPFIAHARPSGRTRHRRTRTGAGRARSDDVRAAANDHEAISRV